MQWQLPAMLILVLVVAVIVAITWRRYAVRDAASQDFATRSDATTETRARSAVRSRRLRLVMWIAAALLLVAALAGPLYGSRTKVLKRRGIDLVIAIDASKSMLAQDVRPSRIARAKGEIAEILRKRPGDRIGIVAFAGESISFPMTIDHAALRLFLRDLDPARMPVGGSEIGDALLSAKDLIERSTRDVGDQPDATRPARVVLLFTDAEAHDDSNLQEAAAALRDSDIRLYAIGVGSPKGEPIPVLNDAGERVDYARDERGEVVMSALTPDNERALKTASDTTSGLYVRAPDGTVGAAQVNNALLQLDTQEQNEQRITIRHNHFAWLIGLAILLLSLEALWPESWVWVRDPRGVSR